MNVSCSPVLSNCEVKYPVGQSKSSQSALFLAEKVHILKDCFIWHDTRTEENNWMCLCEHISAPWRFLFSSITGGGGGGGGLFLACEDFGRMFDNLFSASALFFFFFCYFSEVEISSRTLIPLFGQDQSTVTQRAETTVTECSLTSCMWACFLINSHTCLDSSIVSPLWHWWVNGIRGGMDIGELG